MNTKKTINVQGVMAMQATNKNLDKDWSEIPQEQQFKNLNMKYINKNLNIVDENDNYENINKW